MDETEILVEKFKIAAEIQDRYNNLFWYRTSVFFAIVSALFAGYGFIGAEVFKQALIEGPLPEDSIPFILTLIIFGGVGAYLSWLWRLIHKRATFLQNYYRFRASVLEKEIGNEPEIFAKTYEIATKEKTSRKKSKKKSEKELEEEKQKEEERWQKLYGGEWQQKRNEWNKKMEELKKDYKDIKAESWESVKNKDAGSLRDKLERVYWVFFGVWIVLSLLGVVIYFVNPS